MKSLKKYYHRLLLALVAACAVGSAGVAGAEIKVGVALSTTGPAATIGISSRNAVEMWPQTLGGEPVKYVILDDASDPSSTVRNFSRFINEDKVDVIVGPNITAGALAALDLIAESETPTVTLVGSGVVVNPPDDPKKRWVFKMAATDALMADTLTQYMATHGVKTVGFIGFADSYGESWLKEFKRSAAKHNIQIVGIERFNRTDASVTGPVLKLMGLKPDAILVAGSGTPSVLPQKTLKQRNYKGQVYQTHGIATPEFLKVGGKDVEGTIFPTQPVVVAQTLPEDHPVRAAAVAFTQAYNGKYGENTVTQFAGDASGAYPVLNAAVQRALQKGSPGTREFRTALRDELEKTKDVVMPNGIVNSSPQDHVGLDVRSAVMGVIKNNQFVYLSE